MAVKKTASSTKPKGKAAPEAKAAPKAAAKKETTPKAAAPKAAKAAAPKAAKAAKAAAPKAAKAAKAAPKKKAAAPKLTTAQAEILKKVGSAGDAGYVGDKKESRTLEALRERKLVKRGAKDKASGNTPYMLSNTGKKHLEAPAPTPPPPAAPPAGGTA